MAEWSDLVDFKTKGQVMRIQNDPITMKMWVHERDNYTKIQKFDTLFPSKEYIFVLEAKELPIPACEFSFLGQMIYNAKGDMMKPFIIHKGQIVNAVQTYFQEDMVFCKTKDGNLSESVIVEVFKAVER